MHFAVCTRPAANRTRLAGHEKPLLGPGRYLVLFVRYSDVLVENREIFIPHAPLFSASGKGNLVRIS